jgi:hypothetical protein
MWSAIRWLLLRIAAIRWVFKLGWLGLLIPLAFVLKSIGLPLLIILAVLALPVLVMFFVFGLPVFLVVAAGGAFMGFISFVLTLSLAVLKIGLFIVFPIWFIFAVAPRIARWFRGGNGGNGGGQPTTSTPPPPPRPPPPPPDAAGDFDPL